MSKILEIVIGDRSVIYGQFRVCLCHGTEFVCQTNVKIRTIHSDSYSSCVYSMLFLCCVVLSKRTKPKKIIVVLLLLLSKHLQHTHRLETLVRIENERTE